MATLTLVLAMCACGGGKTPSAVAEKAITCLQNNDAVGYVDLAYIPDEATNKEDQKAGLVDLVQKKVLKSLEEKGGIKSFEIVKEEISEDGNSAVVTTKFEYGNGETKESDMKLVKANDDWLIQNF